VQAAYKYEWSIHWGVWAASSSSSPSDDDDDDDVPGMRGIAASWVGGNEFQYYFGDVAIVPMKYEILVELKRGA
jgi:hypothetical protein